MAGRKALIRNDFTMTADAALGSYLNYPVTVQGAAADAGVELCNAATDIPIGVIVGFADAGAASDQLRIAGVGDVVPVKCTNTVTRGARVKVDTTGYGILDTATSGGAGLVGILGIALESGSADDLVLVLIAPGTNYYAA